MASICYNKPYNPDMKEIELMFHVTSFNKLCNAFQDYKLIYNRFHLSRETEEITKNSFPKLIYFSSI